MTKLRLARAYNVSLQTVHGRVFRGRADREVQMSRSRWTLFLVCTLLQACGPQLRMRQEPAVALPAGNQALADYHWLVAAPDGVSVTLHTVLVRDSQGSWVRDADWDEYILTVANAGPALVTLDRLQLDSNYLPAPATSSISRQQLEERSRDTKKNIRDTAVVAGSGAVVVGATAAVATASYAGAVIAPAVGFILLPMVGSEWRATALRRNREHQDSSLIQLTILERGFHLPLSLAPGVEATRSAFFPLTPAPNRLVVAYHSNGELHTLELPLPALAGLHLKSTGTP